MNDKVRIKAWHELTEIIAPEILHAPKTCGDPYTPESYPQVHPTVVQYLASNTATKPWGNHLALLAALFTAQRLDPQTIRGRLIAFHTGFTRLFTALNLQTMQEWDVEIHLPRYLSGTLLPDDTITQRDRFWRIYCTSTRATLRWFDSLPAEEQARYTPFVLPRIDSWDIQKFLNTRTIRTRQQQRRKAATDAVVPHFALLRAEAHRRFNCLHRLHQAYQAALAEIDRTDALLPFIFSYEEQDERLFFQVWDRRSFICCPIHEYSPAAIRQAKGNVASCSDLHNHRFLEFIRAEPLRGDTSQSSLWFFELLQRGLLGDGPRLGSPEEIVEKQAWLRAWGYGSEAMPGAARPFHAIVPGLLSWELDKGAAKFIAEAQKRTQGVLIPIQSLCDAAMFGLLAISLFTTTGMRVNEAMQIRLSNDCFFRVSRASPPGSGDQTPRVRYGFRLIPKGERTDTPQDYFIGQETKTLLTMTAKMLQEHYQLQTNEPLPIVPYAPRAGRAHRFGPGRYIFQYHHSHLDPRSITACMRFLAHGLVFTTSDGANVVISPHLLRHAFATYAAHVEKIPLDVIGVLLKHKHMDVTEYYAQPTNTIVAAWTEPLLDRLATHIDLQQEIVRVPEELHEQLSTAIAQIGTLHETLGGDCALHGLCPIQFACIGCAAMVPDPRKRYQIERERKRAIRLANEATREGRYPDAERWKQHARRCDTVLQEMSLIEEWQADEQNNVIIRLEPTR